MNGYDKESKLDWVGYTYMAGDAALIASALLEKPTNYWRASTGLLWGMVGVVAAAFGREPAEHQLKEVNHRLRHYLDSERIVIPKDVVDARQLVARDGLWHSVQRFFYKHPTEVMMSLEGLGGASMFKGEWRKDPPNRYLQAGSILTIAAGLAGLLIPEKKDCDEEKEPKSRITERIKEQPLRVTSALLLGNNALMIPGTLFERRQGRDSKSNYLLAFTTACYILGNLAMAFSYKSKEKNHRTNKDIAMPLEEVCAAVVAAQPEEKRRPVIEMVSHYLAAQPEVKVDAETLAQHIHARVNEIALRRGEPPTRWQNGVMSSASPPSLSM